MATFNDGSVPFGSQAVTINGVLFVAENITVNEPTTVIERRNEVGDPSGQVIVPQFINGTATLQLATTSTVCPTIGATFTLTRSGTPAATFAAIVSEVGEQLNQTDAKKVAVSFRKKYN